MKKFILIMLIALFAVGFVFAEGKDYGKIVVGGKTGYLPQLKLAQIDATGRWLLDFTPSPEFTTDFAVNAGIMTDFKDEIIFDAFIGAGMTYALAVDWNVYANCGLDIMAKKNFCELGVAANAGCEYYIIEHLAISGNVKVAEYMKSRQILFKPSIGVSYSF